MGTRNGLTIIFHSAPTTGGSGGDGAPNKNIWAHPEPQAIFGMNSNFVYGANVQVACPLNFQVALGSNVQICVNPMGWQTLFMDNAQDTMPAEFNQLMGSGLGGNMQFTMGTSASVVMGQIFDINLGPRRITIDVHNKTLNQPAVKAMGQAIMIVVSAFVLAYALIPWDDLRAAFVMAFQIIMQIMLIVFMDVQGLYKKMDLYYRTQLDSTFVQKVDHVPPTKGEDPDKNLDEFSTMPSGGPLAKALKTLSFEGWSKVGTLEVIGLVVVIVLPVILEIVSEIKLHNPPQAKPVIDSGGTQIGTVDDSKDDTGYSTF